MDSNEIQQTIDGAIKYADNSRAGAALRLEAARVQLLVDTIGQTASQTPEIHDSSDFDGEKYIEVKHDVVECLTNRIFNGSELEPPHGKLGPTQFVITEREATDIVTIVVKAFAEGGMNLQ